MREKVHRLFKEKGKRMENVGCSFSSLVTTNKRVHVPLGVMDSLDEGGNATCKVMRDSTDRPKHPHQGLCCAAGG